MDEKMGMKSTPWTGSTKVEEELEWIWIKTWTISVIENILESITITIETCI